MNVREIVPVVRPLDATIIPPGSKSITNRALLLAALCQGTTRLEGVLDAEDTQLMLRALQSLGLNVHHDSAVRQAVLTGCGGRFPARSADIYVGNSGTTARFLTAALCFSDGDYRIYGKPRMHERPIRDLVDALRPMGADIRFENTNGCPPVLIRGSRKAGVTTTTQQYLRTEVFGEISSQYLSALLMAAPSASDGGNVEIAVTGQLVSVPYVTMTLAMLQSFGIDVETDSLFSRFRFKANSVYQSPAIYRIEPDASAASYFFAAAAICGGTVRIPGLSRKSLQGDVAFVDCLAQMGCDVTFGDDTISVTRSPQTPLRGVSVDMNAVSDTAQTLGVVALFAEGPTDIRNIEHIRFKETDRLAAMATELRKFGAIVDERPDGLTIRPPKQLAPCEIDTYDDHRMAMSFAVAGLRLPGVVIRDPNCVEKTFPEFFGEIANLKNG